MATKKYTKQIAALLALTLLSFALPARGDLGTGLRAAEREDYATAFREWLPLAQQGNARAQFNLGVMYNKGRGVPQNYKEAMKWYRKAAEQRDADAQLNIGVMYEEGHGVEQDYREAVRWYRKAAVQGNAKAQTNLGAMYDEGLGVPQDYWEAMKWYRKAAEQGDTRAQFNLGVMYEEGEGVMQDYVQAHMWYNLAASQGEDVAQEARDSVAKKMTPWQIAEAQRLAKDWRPSNPEENRRPSPAPLPARSFQQVQHYSSPRDARGEGVTPTPDMRI